MTRERVRLVAWALIIGYTASLLFLFATANGDMDLQGRPLGTDFSEVYAAGTFVLEGKPEIPFDPAQHYARERAIFGEATQFYGWHYPPYFLFIAAALATLPYRAALLLWVTTTLALYLLSIRAIVASASHERLTVPEPSGTATAMEKADRGWLLLALAFPAVLINVGHGQNGFLTAALIGGALVILDRRPLLAGILFGLLIYKPQFGLLLPVVLVATGRWRCATAAAATVLGLTLATTFAFGTQVWYAFLESTHFTRSVVLEQGNTGWYKIQSIFSWARMWGAPVLPAYMLQGIAAVALGVALVRLWRSDAAYSDKAAALCIATILATPYTLDYDLTVLAPAIAFLAAGAFRRGFGPWEMTMLALLWLVPLLTRSVAHLGLIPLGVPAMAAALIITLRRKQLGPDIGRAAPHPSLSALASAPQWE